jgi:hypothetical protein
MGKVGFLFAGIVFYRGVYINIRQVIAYSFSLFDVASPLRCS